MREPLGKQSLSAFQAPDCASGELQVAKPPVPCRPYRPGRPSKELANHGKRNSDRSPMLTTPSDTETQTAAAVSPAVAALARLAIDDGHWKEGADELRSRLFDALEEQAQVPMDELDRLALASTAVGLRARVVEADLRLALDRVERGESLLADLSEQDGGSGEPHWLALHSRIEDRVHRLRFQGSSEVEGEISLAELSQEISGHAHRTRPWLALEPVPVEPATSASSVPAAPLPPLRRLMRLFRPDRSDLIAVVLFAVTTGTLLLATPIAVQALVNFVALGGALPPLIVVAVLLFLVLGVAGIFSAFQTWIVEILQRRLFVRMVADLGARLPRVEFSTYDRRFGPELVNRFFDIVTIQKTGASLLLDGLTIFLGVTVGLVVLAFYHPLLLAFDILLLGAIALIVLGPVRRGVRTAVAESKAKYAVAAWFDEIVRQPLLFRTAGVEPWVFRETDRVARDYIEKRSAHFRVLFGQIIGAVALHAIASTVLLGIGGLLVIRGSLTLGQLVAAELIVTLIVSSVAKMGKHIESFYDLMAATDKVGQLLDLPVEASDKRSLPSGPRDVGAELELWDVTRARPGARPLFEGLSATVHAGTALGVSGVSGTGKSALLEMLWGLRQPDRGTILLDGHSVGEMAARDLRRTTSLVADVEVLVGTVRDNVRLGRSGVTEEVIRDVLNRVDLLSTIERLPDGLDTQLSPRGWPLSAGEVRCLQVARVLADPPRLLLLSETFQHVSGERRERLKDVVFDSEAPWTVVVVSNAPDVLARCDQTLELPSGQLKATA